MVPPRWIITIAWALGLAAHAGIIIVTSGSGGTGACCYFDGSCEEDQTIDQCDAAGGQYLGDRSNCSACVTEACCLDEIPCQDLTPLVCWVIGGQPQGPGTQCASPKDGTGACCESDGTCVEDQTQVQCSASGGEYQGCGTNCESDDSDGDGIIDACDNCPEDNPDDSDGDGICDSDDPCPLDNPDDTDGDGVCDSTDNCDSFNPGQLDCQPNGVGDVCDLDDGTSQDCNANAIPDECDITDGTSDDCNADGTPDECEPCVGDLNCDGIVGAADLAILLANWGLCADPAECLGDIQGTGDGFVGADDLAVLLAAWGPCG